MGNIEALQVRVKNQGLEDRVEDLRFSQVFWGFRVWVISVWRMFVRTFRDFFDFGVGSGLRFVGSRRPGCQGC